VRRQIGLGDEAIGRRHGLDPGIGQLADEPVLKRLEHPLRASRASGE